MGKTGLILLTALFAAIPAHAQIRNVPESTLLTAANPKTIADYVRLLGRPAELEIDEAGEPTIATGFAGYPARIWFFDCEADGSDCTSIRLQLGIGTVHKLSLAQVNAYNQERRFVNLSLDEEGDPILAYDLSLVKPGVSAAVFGDSFRLFDEQALALVEMVKAAEKAAK